MTGAGPPCEGPGVDGAQMNGHATMGAMAKPPSKRGTARGKSSKSAGFLPDFAKPAKGKSAGPQPTGKGGPKHKAAQRPGWMPAPPPSMRGAPPRSGSPAAPRPAPHRDPNHAREAARYEQPIASRE